MLNTSNLQLTDFGSSFRTCFSFTDWLGTERVRTGASPTPVETCQSAPYGDMQSCTNTDVTPMHFTGDERDAESNLDHTEFRQYSSSLGRWASPDPSGIAAFHLTDPQSINRYVYARNTPLSMIDPTGLDPSAQDPTCVGNGSGSQSTCGAPVECGGLLDPTLCQQSGNLNCDANPSVCSVNVNIVVPPGSEYDPYGGISMLSQMAQNEQVANTFVAASDVVEAAGMAEVTIMSPFAGPALGGFEGTAALES